MILAERVLGSSAVKQIPSGLGYRADILATWLRSPSASAGPACTPPRGETNATTPCPFTSCYSRRPLPRPLMGGSPARSRAPSCQDDGPLRSARRPRGPSARSSHRRPDAAPSPVKYIRPATETSPVWSTYRWSSPQIVRSIEARASDHQKATRTLAPGCPARPRSRSRYRGRAGLRVPGLVA